MNKIASKLPTLFFTLVLLQCNTKPYIPEFEGEKLCGLFAQMNRNDQKNREVFESPENRSTVEWVEQSRIDSLNTKLLLEIVAYRGFPNSKNCSCDTFPEMVFMHSPPFFFPEIRKVIDREHHENRLNDLKFNLYNYHINGRHIDDLNPEYIEFDNTLKEKLLRMEKEDQDVSFPPDNKTYSLLSIDSVLIDWEKRRERVYFDNYQQIKIEFQKHGFLGYDLVGESGSNAFWLMVQHSDFDISFQEMVLKSMRIEVENKNANPRSLALLTDRVLINKGEQQVYGTQVTYKKNGQAIAKNIENWAKVDDARIEIGLDSLHVYLNFMTKMHYEMNKENLIKRGVKEPIMY